MHRGLADAAVLDTYGPERTGHVREIIDEAVAAGRVICELDPDRAAARDAAMPRQRRATRAATREPPHPRLGEPSLTVPSARRRGAAGAAGPGHRRRATGLFDDIAGGGWQLDQPRRGSGPAPGRRGPGLVPAAGRRVADASATGSVVDLDGTYGTWFARHGCDAFLSRPDFYVFAAGDDADAPALVAQLRAVVQPADGHGTQSSASGRSGPSHPPEATCPRPSTLHCSAKRWATTRPGSPWSRLSPPTATPRAWSSGRSPRSPSTHR